MAGIRYCESCGAVLQEGFRFCESCGAPVRVLASGPSGAPSGYGMEATSPGYGDVPDFGGGEYGYGGYDIGTPDRMAGGNDAFVGAVPPPAGGDVSFFPGDMHTEILGRSPGDRPTGEYHDAGYGGYPGPAPGGDAFGGYPGPAPGGDAFSEYPGPAPGGNVFGGYPGPAPGGERFEEYPGRGYSDPGYGGYPGSGYDVYPGDVPPGESSVPEGFERGYAGDISVRRDSRYDEPAVKPKLKSSMGPASAKGKGEAVSEEAKPYFREGGDL